MDTVAALALIVLFQLATLAAIVGLAFAAGAPWVDRLAPRAGLERLALAISAGLGVWGTALFGLGIAGGLRRSLVLALAALVVAVFAWHLRSRRGRGRGREIEERGARLGLVATALALLPAFVATLYPPTGWDVTVYHLPFARAFVAAGRLVATPDLVFTVFPQLAEVTFAALLAVTRSDLAPALVQWVAVGAVALLLIAAGERWFSRRAGLWAAALWLAHPLVHYQAGSAYVDAIQALFGLLALLAWERWREEESRARRATGWLFLAGAGAGWGASTKYPGLVWLLVLGIATLVTRPIPGGLGRFRAALLFAGAALLVAAPWYGRNWAETGSPFHPFFSGERPRSESSVAWVHAYTAVPLDQLPRSLGRRALDVARRPDVLARFAWNAAFVPSRFDRQAPLSPWSLALVPLAALFAIRDARLRRWLLLVLGYALLWTTLQPRFQLVGAAVLSLAGAAALERTAAALPRFGRLLSRRRATALVALALVATGPLYATYKVVKRGLPPTDRAERDAYLDRELAGWAGIAWLERERGSSYSVFALGASNLTDFASGRVRGQSRGPWRAQLLKPFLQRPRELHRALRAMGVDYMLVTRGFGLPVTDPAFRELFRRVEGDARHDLYELSEPANSR